MDLDAAQAQMGYGFQLAVVTDKLVELAADPVGMAGGTPCLLVALVDEGLATLLLLFGGERHIDQFGIAQQEIARGESKEDQRWQGSAYLEGRANEQPVGKYYCRGPYRCRW